jgi:hypothetical protein
MDQTNAYWAARLAERMHHLLANPGDEAEREAAAQALGEYEEWYKAQSATRV